MHDIRVIGACTFVALSSLLGACSSEGATRPIETSATASSETTSASTETTTSEPDATTTVTEPSSGSASTTTPLDELSLTITEIGSGFDAPVLLVADPDGGADLVVEQPGRVVRVDADRSVMLDISIDVTYGGEQGLLGLAFHPQFSSNRLAYVNYVDVRGRTVIEEFAVGKGGEFDTSQRAVILAIDQPAANHNGGMIAFGPDGYLWIGMGDGGAANDRFGNGQNPDSLLGAMLRIGVGGGGYVIPENNPFAHGGGAPEVWSIGLRNPWRFSFDGDDVWIADVGQGEFEEVNVVSASEGGLNYGWPIMEGTSCFQSASCEGESLVLPIAEYDHSDGCSVSGGHVYRGESIPELEGQYFYADFCSGILRSYSLAAGGRDWTDIVGALTNASGFGIGGDGELYIVSLGGSVHRFETAS